MGVKEQFFSLPSQDEIEITLIGTGGGYGESVVLKINDCEWVIIDSCINPDTKFPLSIEYLSKIGVDYKTNVKFVICTHWHNDHILGISKTLELCENAEFCAPHVNNTKMFTYYVNMDYAKMKKGSISSFNEFKDCMEIIKTRGDKNIVKRMRSDLVLHAKNMTLSSGEVIKTELCSLSPSDAVIANFDHEISTLFSNFDLSKKTVVEKSANEKSSVIYLRYSEFTALLGADLEVSIAQNEGWKDIFNNSNLINGQSIIYKIPHHGSENGYDKKIYEKLISPHAISKMSPWNKSTKLPQPEMLKTYQTHSQNLYITSPVDISKKPKKRDKSTEKIIRLFTRKLSEVRFNQGIVRTRHSLIGDKKISVETHGSAFKI